MTEELLCFICGTAMVPLDGKDLDNGARCPECGTGAGRKITSTIHFDDPGEELRLRGIPETPP